MEEEYNKTVKTFFEEASSGDSDDRNMELIDTNDDIDDVCTSDFSIEGTPVLEENEFILVDCFTKKNKLY